VSTAVVRINALRSDSWTRNCQGDYETDARTHTYKHTCTHNDLFSMSFQFVKAINL